MGAAERAQTPPCGGYDRSEARVSGDRSEALSLPADGAAPHHGPGVEQDGHDLAAAEAGVVAEGQLPQLVHGGDAAAVGHVLRGGGGRGNVRQATSYVCLRKFSHVRHILQGMGSA